VGKNSARPGPLSPLHVLEKLLTLERQKPAKAEIEQH
jgi:hypothetical protein